MEISSQYTVQVTLLQVPMLAIFCFIYNTQLAEITPSNSFVYASRTGDPPQPRGTADLPGNASGGHGARPSLIFETFDVFTCTAALALMLFVYQSGRTDYFKGATLSFGACACRRRGVTRACCRCLTRVSYPFMAWPSPVYILFIFGYWMVPSTVEDAEGGDSGGH